MADYSILRDVIREITYKPNVELSAEMSAYGDGRVEICISAMVPDADITAPSPLDSDIQIVLRHAVPPPESEEMALEQIRHVLMMFEKHEFEEWFRHKGERVYEPH